jgi:hypothetical protein
MKLLRDWRFLHLPSFQTTRDREVRDLIVISALLCAIAWLAAVTIVDLFSHREALEPRPALGGVMTGEARDAR